MVKWWAMVVLVVADPGLMVRWRGQSGMTMKMAGSEIFAQQLKLGGAGEKEDRN